MRCPNCDYEIKTDTKFCPKCGINLTEKSAILGQKPTVSYSHSPVGGSGSSDLQGAIKVWSVLMLILGLIGTIYFAFRFGYPKVYSFYSSEREFIGKIFFPILIGGIILSVDHYFLMAGISRILEKADNIRYYVTNQRH